MLLQTIFLILLLTLLFLFSKKITSNIYNLIYLLSSSQKLAVGVLAWILLPGTIIHEISHFLIASILRVPTGEISVFPKFDKESREVKTGHVMLGKSDPIRRTIIGLAPLIIGISLIYLIGKIIIPTTSELFNNLSQLNNISPILLLTTNYLLLIISVTMFSSKKDLERLIIAAPITLVAAISLHLVGIRISLAENLTNKIAPILTAVNFYLLVTTTVNFLVLLILGFFLSAGLGIFRPKQS